MTRDRTCRQPTFRTLWSSNKKKCARLKIDSSLSHRYGLCSPPDFVHTRQRLRTVSDLACLKWCCQLWDWRGEGLCSHASCICNAWEFDVTLLVRSLGNMSSGRAERRAGNLQNERRQECRGSNIVSVIGEVPSQVTLLTS